MVRLGAFNKLPESFDGKAFQFQYGAIGRVSLIQGRTSKICFNSSMVRLGVASEPVNPSISYWFQFQYGAIGSETDRHTES